MAESSNSPWTATGRSPGQDGAKLRPDWSLVGPDWARARARNWAGAGLRCALIEHRKDAMLNGVY